MAVEEVEAGVGGNAVEPGPEGRAAREAQALAPGPQQGLLHQILGVLERAEQAVAVHLQLAPVALHACAEGGRVFGVHLGDKRVVVGVDLHSGAPSRAGRSPPAGD